MISRFLGYRRRDASSAQLAEMFHNLSQREALIATFHVGLASILKSFKEVCVNVLNDVMYEVKLITAALPYCLLLL